MSDKKVFLPLEFDNGTVVTDVECKNGNIILNRRYIERGINREYY